MQTDEVERSRPESHFNSMGEGARIDALRARHGRQFRFFRFYGESAAEIESRPPWQPRCL